VTDGGEIGPELRGGRFGHEDQERGRSACQQCRADVDAAYARALKAGATSVQAPEKRDDEDKRGGVKDASGTTWWIATKVE